MRFRNRPFTFVTRPPRNKTHSRIFARGSRRGVYWCRVPLAWGLPKYQSHTRLQIIYVHTSRPARRHQHDGDDDEGGETRRRCPRTRRALVSSSSPETRRPNIFNSRAVFGGPSAILCYTADRVLFLRSLRTLRSSHARGRKAPRFTREVCGTKRSFVLSRRRKDLIRRR